MNELAEPAGRESLDRRGSEPRAVVHKNILDRAAADPEAPMSDVASDVPGATVALVERVLEEYGDPGIQDDDSTSEAGADTAAGAQDGTTDSEREPMAERTLDAHRRDVPDPESLTEKQRTTLRTIREHPEATQAELADLLGVSSATINTRVNAIDGFEWTRRREFVERLFGDDAVDSAGADEDAAANEGEDSVDAETEASTVNERNEPDATNGRSESNDPDEPNGQEEDEANGPNEPDEANGPDSEDGSDGTERRNEAGEPDRGNGVKRRDREDQPDSIRVSPETGSLDDPEPTEALAHRIEELTAVVESVAGRVDESGRPTSGTFEDPGLVHKVLRACLNDDDISPDEELAIVRAVVG